MPTPLRFRVEDGVAWLTLDRPAAHNAVDEALHGALVAAIGRIAGDPDIRAAVLTGAGETFCPGADVWSAPPTLTSLHGGTSRRRPKHDSQQLVRALLELSKPIVAAVNGVAAGLGAQLALACDLVVMAEEARILPVFARRGIAIDAAGAFVLARLVGLLKAKEMVLLGEAVAASDALRLGLCNRVVPRAELAPAAREWAERLARGPTFALGLTKRLLERAYEADLDGAIAEATLAESMAPQSDDPPAPASQPGAAFKLR